MLPRKSQWKVDSICNVWERVFHTAAVIEETEDVDRVILTLSYGGHEQDVDAMLRLYETKGELMVVGDAGKYVNGYMEASGNADKLSINMAIRKNTPRSQETSPKLTFAEDLSCTPSEGVVFFRHFPTPSEGVGGAHHRYRHQRAIFAENLSCTPSEGVAFSRHFPTPSEGVGALTIDTDTRRTTLTNLLRGAL